MRTRALDSQHDWQYGKGRNSYLKDLPALMQLIQTRLLSWKNNCFFALDDGVDWNNYLGMGTKVYLDLDIQRVILQTNGVVRIDSYNSLLDRDTRNLTLTSSVATVYGDTSIIF
jgi:hypothetical protein